MKGEITMRFNSPSTRLMKKISADINEAAPLAVKGLKKMIYDISGKEFWKENRPRKIFLAIITFAVLIFLMTITLPAFAGSVGGFGGATEATQIANNAELGGIYGQTAQQVSNGIQQINNQMQMIMNQVQQYTEMIKQGMSMQSFLTNDIFSQVQDLFSSSVAGSGLFSAYGNSESWINTMGKRGEYLSSTQLAEKQNEEKQDTNKALASRIDNIIRQQSEQAAKIAQLQNMNRGAVGQMQAAQVGNDTMAVIAQELVKLRSDMATYQLSEVQKEQEKLEARERELLLLKKTDDYEQSLIGNW